MKASIVALFIAFITVTCFILYILSNKHNTHNKTCNYNDMKKWMADTIKTEDYGTIIKQNNILCIGSRGSYESVKCIIMDNKLIYCSTLVNWKFTDHNNISVTGVKIPITHTRNTTFQCWPNTFDMSVVNVSEKVFTEYLQELEKRISEGIL